MRRTRSLRAPLVPGTGPLAKVPPIAAFLLVIGLFTAGVLVRGPVGAGLLAVLAAGVALLLAATWQGLDGPGRVGRVVVLVALVVIAVSVL